MRSHSSRLVYAGGLLLALSACSSSTNGLPSGGSPNGTGGGVVNTNPGVGAVPANTVSTKLIDDGTVSKGKYSGFNATALDTQSTAEVPTDGSSLPVLPNPPSPSGPTDGGSHSIAFSGNGLTQVILGYGGTVPNLTYLFGPSGNETSYNYSTIVFHAAYVPSTTSPGTLSGVSLELTGGAAATAYDVRVPCTLPTQPTAPPSPAPSAVPSGSTPAPVPTAAPMLPASFTAPAVSLVTCSGLPAYPTAGFLGNGPNTSGPNAVTPGVTGQFTPISPKLYLVLNYSAPTNTAGGAMFDVDDLYAKQ